jgi:hypothetical protein
VLTATAFAAATFAAITTPAPAVTAITAATTTTTAATTKATRTTSKSTPATPTTSASKLAGSALFTRTGNVHGQRTAFKLLTMKFLDGFLGLVATAHGYEGEAAGTAGELVEDDLDDTDGANLPEQSLEILRSAGEGKVPHVELRVI